VEWSMPSTAAAALSPAVSFFGSGLRAWQAPLTRHRLSENDNQN